MLAASPLPILRSVKSTIGGKDTGYWLRTSLGIPFGQNEITCSDIVNSCKARWLAQTKNLMTIRKMDAPQSQTFKTLCAVFSLPAALYKGFLEQNNLLRKEDE